MKLLAIDTATEACSAAVWIDGAVHARFEVVGRDHTQRLAAVIAGVLAEAGLGYGQLDGLACGVGPGSFAGVRIAVSFAKGVALARDLPVVGVTSLQLLAQRALATAAAPVLAAIDARMGEVYFQAFVRNPQGLAQPVGEAVVAAPALVPLPPPQPAWQAVGTGWGSYAPVLHDRIGQPVVGVDGTALPEARDSFVAALPLFERGTAPAADVLQPIYLRNRVALTLVEQQRLRDKSGAAG